MSWFSRKREFQEEEDILADDFEAEFDGIAEALNGLVQAGRVQASATVKPGTSYTLVPGTEKTIVVTQASLLYAVATFDATVLESDSFTGNLEIDSAVQTQEAAAVAPISLGSGHIRMVLSQTYVKKLSTGSHTVKMVCKRNGTDTYVYDAENTGYSYIVLPDPEP